MQRITLILTIILLGCGTTLKVPRNGFIGEKNKDVLILAMLIQDFLRQSNGRDFNLNELVQRDSLRRISNSFEMTELRSHGGYISVYYKRSKSSNIYIELTDREEEKLKWISWSLKDIEGSYDGEIRLDYGERFYRIKRILVEKE